MTIFHPHGEFRIQLINNVLKVELIGEWNEETAELFVEDCKTEINKFDGQNWGLLALLDKFVLAVPSAVDKGKEFAKWAAQHGCAADALVYQHNTLKTELMTQLSPGHCEANKKPYFVEQSQAIEWLKHRGFSME